MRRIFFLSLIALVAGCATRPQTVPVAQAPQVRPQGEERTGLTGLTVQELAGRYGPPALQIREGTSLKLQFRGPRCVMDAYLYPSAGLGALQVTHVDTRLPTGGDIDQAACIFSLRRTGI